MVNTIYLCQSVTIISDRYQGCYSGAPWLAWNTSEIDIPTDVSGSVIICCDFWENFKPGIAETMNGFPLFCGKGNSPDEALLNLIELVNFYYTDSPNG